MGVGVNIHLGRVLEAIRLTHMPLPPPHRVRLDAKTPTAYADLKTRTVTLNPKSRSLEWDYRHEIEHLNKWPRRLKQFFIHYYKALKLLSNPSDRKLFKRLRNTVANLVYDAFIDTELCHRYPEVRRQVKDYLATVTNPHILDEARALAVKGKRAFWLHEDSPEYSFVHVFHWVKRNMPLVSQFKPDFTQELSEEDVAEAIVDLIDMGEDEEDVVREAEEFLGKRIKRRLILEALVRSRFNFAIKATFDFKVAAEASREVYSTWRLGEPIDELEVYETVRSYGVVIPGHNTLKIETVKAVKGKPRRTLGGCNLALVVDSSGSMREFECWKHARDATLMLLGFAKRYSYPVLLTTFGDGMYYSSRGWRTDHFKLALEFVEGYYPESSYTNVVPSLQEVLRYAKADMTVYVISDMCIDDVADSTKAFRVLAGYKPKIVLFLINPEREQVEHICGAVRRAGVTTVKGYWVNPKEAHKLTEHVIQEINL